MSEAVASGNFRSPGRAILLTAPGSAALAGVRVRGEGVGAWLQRRLSREVAPGRLAHVRLRDDAGEIDDPVVSLSADFQTADLTLHGGPWVVEATLELLKRDGFEVVSFDPFAASTIEMMDGETVLDREVAAALPLARTELAARALAVQPAAWRTAQAGGDWDSQIANPSIAIPLLMPPTVAIVGAPNAGKSTLANALFGRQRSIVSPVAGTTRDWVGEEADLDGLVVCLLDTPGLRATDDAIERQSIAQSATPTREADWVIHLLDGAASVESQAIELKSNRIVRVLNKADVSNDEWNGEPSSTLRVSAKDGTGVDGLRATLRRHFIPWADGTGIPLLIWTDRHRALSRENASAKEIAKAMTSAVSPRACSRFG